MRPVDARRSLLGDVRWALSGALWICGLAALLALSSKAFGSNQAPRSSIAQILTFCAGSSVVGGLVFGFLRDFSNTGVGRPVVRFLVALPVLGLARLLLWGPQAPMSKGEFLLFAGLAAVLSAL